MSTTYLPPTHPRPSQHLRVWLVALAGLAVVLASAVVVAFAAAALAGGSAETHAAAVGNGLIAFTRPDGIYVMRADGSGVRSLRRGGVAAGSFDLAWSPNGRKLAFARRNAIWVMTADGSHLVRLVAAGDARGKAPGSLASPTWAPDGRRIAFTAGHRYDRDIWLVNADGSSLRRLARTHGYKRNYNEVEVDWNPRGARLAFSGAGWVTQIAVINTNGSNLRTSWGGSCGGVWCATPDWSPDGHRIAFTDGKDISIISADNDDPMVRLTPNKTVDSEPTWSPDGKRIAFVRADVLKDAGEIYVMNADGTEVTRLTHNRIVEASPAWRPLGREER